MGSVAAVSFNRMRLLRRASCYGVPSACFARAPQASLPSDSAFAALFQFSARKSHIGKPLNRTSPGSSFVQSPLHLTGRHLSKTSCQQAAREVDVPTQLLNEAEVRHVHAAVRAKCLEAIAVGNLPPGRELELISALDLGTVPWSLVPVKLKEQLGLPLEDKGIDSLALNLTVAVQAKDYSNSVPLNRLTNFHFMVQAKGSPLRSFVKQLVVATNSSTTLPQHWQWSEAVHRQYTADEIEAWRARAQVEQQHESKVKVPKSKLKRWPHQVDCLRKCRKFMKHRTKRDFFVQMATGAGKSLVMADLLAGLGPGKRSCIIVPKLDLMEQLAQLLEETLPAAVARVGTGHPADLGAEVFVCVRNSAWQLSNLTFDLLILDEAHHYEPEPNSSAAGLEAGNGTMGVHARQVLALNGRKRIFFTATLLMNKPDFDFSLRPAIEAGIIKDYAVMVPVLSEGDPRPGLIKIIQNLPLSRKILAFCNTVCEAKHFTKMLCAAGIPADHYNASTSTLHRQDILRSFQRSEKRGGIRVLVTVDVLSEGVDLPVADTCLFVAPRQGVRLQQCVGRVLRNHPEKVDALVIAPPVVQHLNGTVAEDGELERLLGELARADQVFQQSLGGGEAGPAGRVGVLPGTRAEFPEQLVEKVAEVLRVRVFPHVLQWIGGRDACWERGFAHLQAYKTIHGHVVVPGSFVAAGGFKLGRWVIAQRAAKKQESLSPKQKMQKKRLEEVGFVWRVRQTWDTSFQKLLAYQAEHGDALVPRRYRTSDGFRLGKWVIAQRWAETQGKLSPEQKNRLKEVGFAWRVRQTWDTSFQKLLAYQVGHGDVLVPQRYRTSDGFRLGMWVNTQRRAETQGKLSPEQKNRLKEVGFVWSVLQTWDTSFQKLLAYQVGHGDVLVPQRYRTSDGFRLGMWVNTQRWAETQGKLSAEQKNRLKEVGFVWRACGNQKLATGKNVMQTSGQRC